MAELTRDEICDRFLEAVTFDLFPVQEEALLAWFECEGGLMVCAPTGMGKTLIAEAAVYEALQTRTRLYYTTPLIALTEQKYRDLQDKADQWGFSREDVGFITGNRRENPDALIRVVVAEILLNHLLSTDESLADFQHTHAVVMDEFHSFNDRDRGVVWELSLVLLPKHVRVMLLSATVGNPLEFGAWLHEKHGRRIRIVRSEERRVPLEYVWVGDQLMTEVLPTMSKGEGDTKRTPALVFCFNRDECWEVAEKLKGLPLIPQSARDEIEKFLDEHPDALEEGIGPKLRQMLIRGVGVHHAGIIPKRKLVVEELFLRKLVPFVVCTETLAAGINLPARSVVLSTLIKGKPRERKLIPSSSAHQMFGRAGRPQFDTHGYVYAVAHDDDVKIAKWQKKYEQIDPKSKDPGIMRARKDLERKKPSRRKTEQYWTEGQFRSLIEAGPGKLQSRSMIPYSVLIFLLTKLGALHHVKDFLRNRFATADQIEKFEKQLEHMLDNLATLSYLTRAEDGDHVTLHDSIWNLLNYRSVDPLYGEFLVGELNYANFEEKLYALESVLEVPYRVVKKAGFPDHLEPGPLQREKLEPLLTQMGVRLDWPDNDEEPDPWATEEDLQPPPRFPDMLKIAFDARLAAPEDVYVMPKWLAGWACLDFQCEFFKFTKARQLAKEEGQVLRHLLRLVILAGEFHARSEDPDYQRIAELSTRTCQRVDKHYTDRFLAEAQEMETLNQAR